MVELLGFVKSCEFGGFWWIYLFNFYALRYSLKMKKEKPPIHPGEILLEDFMKPMGISARQLAADIDVSPSRISEVVNHTRPITADTALRLGLFFNMEPRFWMNLQAEYDMRIAKRELHDKISPRIRVFQPAAGWLFSQELWSYLTRQLFR